MPSTRSAQPWIEHRTCPRCPVVEMKLPRASHLLSLKNYQNMAILPAK